VPGAPNSPPKTTAPPPSAAPAPEPPEKKVLRRLVPSRVTLLLDLWKGAPSPDLTGPYEMAEAAFAQGDFAGALSALDRLSVRFAEPRWPILPEPFRSLRVFIFAPMPPHWNPDHALPATEKDAKQARKTAEEQLALARGSLAWASAHGIDASDLAPKVDAAAVHLAEPDGLVPFYAEIDAVWTGLHGRLPAPKGAAARAPPPAAAEVEEA
jgi:hypothetical protein